MKPTVIETLIKLNQKIGAPRTSRTGVLLVNTGSPERYTYWSMRSYLSEFLSDRRVVDLPRALWWPILYLGILPFRPLIKAQHYKSIWNRGRDEAPLRTLTRNQATLLGGRLNKSNVEVEWAFRYGGPTIKSKMDTLKSSGCDRLLVVPLFPQYSSASTAAVVDELKERDQMALRTMPAFYNEQCYTKAIATSINNTLESNRFYLQAIIFSYHGIPLSYHTKGDPYALQCHCTTRLVQKQLDVKCGVLTAFQSRFGRGEWLKPYTEDVVVNLARNGVKRIAVVAAGFVCDCLETIDEIEQDAAQSFRANGGEQLLYVPCLNDSDASIDMLETLVRKHLHGFAD